jgi:hypothetical protein
MRGKNEHYRRGPLLSAGDALRAPDAPLQHEGSFRPHQFPPSKIRGKKMSISAGSALRAPDAPLQHEGSFRPHQFPPSKMSTIEGPLLSTGSALRAPGAPPPARRSLSHLPLMSSSRLLEATTTACGRYPFSSRAKRSAALRSIEAARIADICFRAFRASVRPMAPIYRRR